DAVPIASATWLDVRQRSGDGEALGKGNAKRQASSEAQEGQAQGQGPLLRFGYACARGHEVIAEFPVGAAPRAVRCLEHDEAAARVFDVPHFTEDRRR